MSYARRISILAPLVLEGLGWVRACTRGRGVRRPERGYGRDIISRVAMRGRKSSVVRASDVGRAMLGCDLQFNNARALCGLADAAFRLVLLKRWHLPFHEVAEEGNSK